MDKKYRTHNGKAVRLFTTTASDSEYPVVGEIGDSIQIWTADGYYDYSGGSDHDLVEIKPVEIKPWRWYAHGSTYYHIYNIDHCGLFAYAVNRFGVALWSERISYLNTTDWIEIPNPFAEEK
jgi:hypothetical protein